MTKTAKCLKKFPVGFLSTCRKFKKNDDGSLAIEFGFIGLPFFMLLFAVLEVSMVFFAEVNITHATGDTARKVRTLQGNVNSVSDFVSDVCAQVLFVPNCSSKLKVEVRVFDNFSTIDSTDPLDNQGDLKDSFVFDLGAPGSVITVRTFLEWDLFANLPDLGLGNMPNGNRLIEGYAVFRNEG